ncbi:MAG: hypothetical protein WAK98_00540 [Gemmobacter sp.]
MRILRQDTGFSAKLGFGEFSGTPPVSEARVEPPAGLEGPAGETESAEARRARSSMAGVADPGSGPNTPEVQGSSAGVMAHPGVEDHAPSRRGHVVHVAVALTAEQAVQAEVWAKAARCPVPFLIRRIAQGLRDRLCDDWEQNGMPEVVEHRGARGKYPTSVTLTLRPQIASTLAARQDPCGMLGLGRVIGPAFRAGFQMAFDEALNEAELSLGIGAAGS